MRTPLHYFHNLVQSIKPGVSHSDNEIIYGTHGDSERVSGTFHGYMEDSRKAIESSVYNDCCLCILVFNLFVCMCVYICVIVLDCNV